MSRSEILFKAAQKVMPGGVNSPVRAFLAVDDTPRFIKKAKGSRIYDVDGNSYIDYIGSWGPMILGHSNEAVLEAVEKAVKDGLSFGAATEAEVEMAELICSTVPSIEMVRMVNSGTEAVMSAIRAARGYTGRDKIIKFEGCYHGHSDAMLVKAGSGMMTSGVPDSAGVPQNCAVDTLTAVYNDIRSVESLFEKYKNQIAAVIIEPVAANMGVVLPEDGFLQNIRRICDENQALLIFDEVITGFRLGRSGAQGYFGVEADITTFGKIIGGGMPVGAYGGRQDIMKNISPLGKVYQAGTLSGNPIAMAAGIAVLKVLTRDNSVYEYVNKLGSQLADGLRGIIDNYEAPLTVNSIGSLSSMFFTGGPVNNYGEAKESDRFAYQQYFKTMLANGIYLAPSQFEAAFVSYAHKKEDIDYTLHNAGRFIESFYQDYKAQR